MAKDFMSGYATYDTSNGYGNANKWKKAFHQRMTGQEAEEILSSQNDTPWGILGVSRDATAEQIKKAFRALMMKWHPDRNPDNITKATEMSKIITAAYTKLTK